jgi:hypothetical protein
MPRATQLTVCLENKPGQIATLGDVLRRAKVNILALSVVDNTDAGVIRLVTDSSAKAAQALTRAGMKPTRQSVLVLHLPNKPGALAAAAAKLAKARININYTYGSVPRTAAEGMVVFSVAKLAQALRVT